MPGPPPKDPAVRQRRNKVAGAGVLEDDRQEVRVPPLPTRRGEDGKALPKGDPRSWLRPTRAWWRDVWRSPMAARFTDADVHSLYILAELVDQFYRTPTTQLAAEIRQQRQCFGLTPLDRLRLQWEVRARGAGAAKAHAPEPPPAEPTPPPPAAEDPRAILRAVK